jgi:hypothetical protein
VELRVKHVCHLTGIVTDTMGESIPQVKVILLDENGQEIRSVPTDNNGRFQFNEARAFKRYKLHFIMPGMDLLELHVRVLPFTKDHLTAILRVGT